MPAGFHDYVYGITLPIGVNDVTAGQIVEILAVMHVGPKAHRAIGECALTSVDVLLREHYFVFLGFGTFEKTVFKSSYTWIRPPSKGNEELSLRRMVVVSIVPE